MIKVDINNREDIRNSLISLCANDEDMNGNNGEEYLWKCAKESGYNSNAEYLADASMDMFRKPQDMFEYFAREFYETNSNYYDGYYLDILLEDNMLYVAFDIYSAE